MANFSMTCTCGHVMEVDAENQAEAAAKLKAMMNQEALDQHFAAMHSASEPKPTLEQAHAMIDQVVTAAA